MRKTSLQAHKGIKEGGVKQIHYAIILDAFALLRNNEGTALDLSGMCKLDYWQVSRRLGEMASPSDPTQQPTIEDTGRLGKSRSNRRAVIYRLVTTPAAKVQMEMF